MNNLSIRTIQEKVFDKFCLVFLFCALNYIHLEAQHLKTISKNQRATFQNSATSSEVITTECSGLVIPDTTASPFLTTIKNLEKKHIFSSEIERIKSIKTENKLTSPHVQLSENTNSSSPISLSVVTSFQGNIFDGGVPPDNTIAIANNGNIVSVVNCNVAYYTSSGNQLWTGSFWELFNDPTLTELIYDPNVLYDSQADRFVMIAVHGFTSATSKLIISFSKTNNPKDGWWVYKLSGNPLSNSCWLDYPKIGVSNNELFISGNLYNDNTGYSESIIYQIGKNNGYSGTNLNWIVWSKIEGSPIYILPASYGMQGNYGPGLYFVSQSPGRGNSVSLYEITDDLAASPQLTRNEIVKSDYEPSGNAQQLRTTVELITGDCKIQNAFFLDGILHYVFQSDYQNSNYTGINYNRLHVNTLTNESYSYGQIGFDCAYPTVALYGRSQNDKSVIFCYLRSGASIFPEINAVVFDTNQTWSNSILVKSSTTYVDAFQYDNTARWGDYTGIAHRYNPSGREIWLSGCYGANQKLFATTYNCFKTWIAQISNTTLSTNEQNPEPQSELKLFPNPTIDLFTVEFEVVATSSVRIDVTDLNGNAVTLFNGNLKQGKNLLTFNRRALSSGTYFITVKSSENIMASKKLVIE